MTQNDVTIKRTQQRSLLQILSRKKTQQDRIKLGVEGEDEVGGAVSPKQSS